MSSANLNLSTVELTSSLLTAPLNGAPSSADYNDSQRANLVDLSTIVSFLNNQVLPLINALSAGALQPASSPVGIQGSTVWTNTSDQGELFFDSLSSTPLTIYETFNILNGMITTFSQQLTDLGVEVAALQSLLASTNQNDISLALQNLSAALNQLTVNQNLGNVSLSGLQAEINTIDQEIAALQAEIGSGGGGGGSGASFYSFSAFEGDPTLTKPAASQILCVNQLLGSTFVTSVTLPVGLVGSTGGCKVAPTGNVTITINQNGSSIGTINIASGSTAATFTFANQVVLNPSDVVSFVFQGTTDATVAGIWWTIGGSIIPGGGSYSGTLAADLDVSITTPTNGQVLTYNTAAQKWQNVAPFTGNLGINNQTANYTLALTDINGLVRMNVAAPNTVTVPPSSSVAFPVGSVISVRQVGVGTTTIAAGAGVLITTPGGLVLSSQYATIQLINVANNTWDLIPL